MITAYVDPVPKQYQIIALHLLTAVRLVCAKTWKTNFKSSVRDWMSKVKELFIPLKLTLLQKLNDVKNNYVIEHCNLKDSKRHKKCKRSSN